MSLRKILTGITILGLVGAGSASAYQKGDSHKPSDYAITSLGHECNHIGIIYIKDSATGKIVPKYTNLKDESTEGCKTYWEEVDSIEETKKEIPENETSSFIAKSSPEKTE